jgi:hypothetical protein
LIQREVGWHSPVGQRHLEAFRFRERARQPVKAPVQNRLEGAELRGEAVERVHARDTAERIL